MGGKGSFSLFSLSITILVHFHIYICTNIYLNIYKHTHMHVYSHTLTYASIFTCIVFCCLFSFIFLFVFHLFSYACRWRFPSLCFKNKLILDYNLCMCMYVCMYVCTCTYLQTFGTYIHM